QNGFERRSLFMTERKHTWRIWVVGGATLLCGILSLGFALGWFKGSPEPTPAPPPPAKLAIVARPLGAMADRRNEEVSAASADRSPYHSWPGLWWLREERKTFALHPQVESEALAVAFSPAGRLFVSRARHRIVLWDLTAPVQERYFPAPP